MQLTLLGTGAAEGYPALFCPCPNCDAARERGGRDFRRRSHALVDDAILIDLGPDLLWSVHQHGLRLDKLRRVLLTHGHADHLVMSNLECRGPGFVDLHIEPWTIHGSAASLALISAEHWFAEARLALSVIAAGETISVGAYTVTALPARHDQRVEPLLYLIERGDAALLYATDSGPWLPETWDILARKKPRLGAAIVEATSGTAVRVAGAPPNGHMNFDELIWHADELKRREMLRPGAQVIAHHFSHNGAPPYRESTEILAPHGIVVGYDGMVVEA